MKGTPPFDQVRELTALYEISRALASSLDLRRTGLRVLEQLDVLLGMSRATLTLLDPSTRELVIQLAHGLTQAEVARGRFKIGEGVTGKVFETGEPILIPDVGRDPRFLNRTRSRGDLTDQPLSFICVPVKVQGETIGALSVDRPQTPDADRSLERAAKLLAVVASLIGQTVRLSQRVEGERQALIEQNLLLRHELKGRYRLENVVGQSDRMIEVYEAVRRVSPSRATVLLRGENGTGKELVARAIHYNSPRAAGPFIRLSCAALPEGLLESELFGHERGAFTGAVAMKRGRFEQAHEGTLFLDEIGDLSPAVQVKLLRVLQERSFERIGGLKTIHVDVRLITATNCDLEAAVKQGRFREDLYYRLNVVPLFLPPLRERTEDIPLLVDHFLKKFNAENGKEVRISADTLPVLQAHPWPGNVRELENLIERLVVMSRAQRIGAEDVGRLLAPRELPVGELAHSGTLGGAVEELERRKIIDALKQTHGVRSKAARRLGITSRQINYRIQKYGIESGAENLSSRSEEIATFL